MQAFRHFSLIFVKKLLNNLIGGHNYDKETIYSTFHYDKETIYSTFHTGIMHQQPKSGNTSGGSCNNARKMHRDLNREHVITTFKYALNTV